MRPEIYGVKSAWFKILILILTLLFAQRKSPWEFTSQALWKESVKVKSYLPRSPQLFEPNDYFPPYLTTMHHQPTFFSWLRLLAYFLVVNKIGALLHMVLVHLLVANGFENGSWPAPSGYIRLETLLCTENDLENILLPSAPNIFAQYVWERNKLDGELVLLLLYLIFVNFGPPILTISSQSDYISGNHLIYQN